MRKLLWLCLIPGLSCFGAQSSYDAGTGVWTLFNSSIRATFQLTPDGYFLTRSIADVQTGDQWTAGADRPTSPVGIQVGNEVFDATRAFTLLDQFTQQLTPSGVRQFIVLQDMKGLAQITVILDVYDDQPVLRYSVRYRNLTASTVRVNGWDMLPWTFSGSGQRYTAFRVNQWSVLSNEGDFEPLQTSVDPGGAPVEVYSGAHGQQCGWIAVRDTAMRGLFAGWEFDGRTKTTARQGNPDGYLQFASAVLDMNHPVEPLGDFTGPSAFLGLFHGDWDEAGYRTQRFVEGVLARPVPDAKNFPYVSWDSWGYETAIDEQTLRHNAQLAASLGVELFVVDLGWSRAIGDWHADESKFPHGLGALSDYVHS
ncbi:MAG TPA: alpha-galactosidase, partial [Bryobacteraceae bacterium]